MIEAKDLRIGNLVLDKYGNIFEVKAILVLTAIDSIFFVESHPPYRRMAIEGRVL